MTPYERLLLPENLYYAWRKAKRTYRTYDGYVNQGELIDFELDLENRLRRIEQQFRSGTYKLQPIKPVPRPKQIEDSTYINRQYYHIAVDDQVAWIAMVNALGPELDDKMPSWSYGNRLYRPAWYEKENPESKLEIGPYRHASGHIYKKFQHSWPLFRKYISLTARTMVRTLKKEEESESDQRAIEAAIKEGLPYIDDDFWGVKKNKSTDLYCASIDLKQFYPNITSDKILSGLILAEGAGGLDGKLALLLKSMLKFTLDKSDIPDSILENVVPPFGKKRVSGLPTGLFVAGFLANAAMLPIDKIVDEKIREKRSLAHFRYVDDHTILAYDFDELCEWAKWYKNLVKTEIGVQVNEGKIDPESLSKWLKLSDNDLNKLSSKKIETAKKTAQEDSKIDGSNPVKLLTKTLEKVSAITGQNMHILDDHDLADRLKDLEWLLLADIPEREIRPDTRAAFAAGQIAVLAPMLIQENGIIDTYRRVIKMEEEFERFKNDSPSSEKVQNLEISLKQQKESLNKQINKLETKERQHLARYFDLLIHAMKQHPGKARLFFRLHQYCMLTGYRGLRQITTWVQELAALGGAVWSDYYANLALQILARNVFRSLRAITDATILRSDQNAAISHLEDIADISPNLFSMGAKNKAWFHNTARSEYAAAMSIAAEYLKLYNSQLSKKFTNVVRLCNAPSFKDTSSIWLEKTGYPSGNWAYFAENQLRLDNQPTRLWENFGKTFNYKHISDSHAVRLYPEYLPENAFEYLLSSKSNAQQDDTGWIYDVLKSNKNRLAAAEKSKKEVFARTVRALKAKKRTHITLEDWTRYVHDDKRCVPFDPRRGEWTALEIIKRIVEPNLEVGAVSNLDRVHPHNILIPKEWIEFKENGKSPLLSWEKWRSYIDAYPKIKFTSLKDSLFDYRYQTHASYGTDEDDYARHKLESEFCAIGRLLVGLLCGYHVAPPTWNIRGNEKVEDIPRAQLFRSLAISSSTLLLIEGCIDPRSAESRLIAGRPSLFGLSEDVGSANDTRYDPPQLNGVNDLIKAIDDAQKVLSENQLAVSMHQPRQLIPFRLSDFATLIGGENEEDMHAVE